MSLVRPLLHDRVDIIGDIHGEVEALRRLLVQLGCDAERCRVERPLVFVGDLVDRGPDSVAVLELVRRLVEAGVAQALLGNHELNILLADPKEGNGWILPRDEPDSWRVQGAHVPFVSRVVSAEERGDILRFLESLPVALESPSLRVVHAAWIPDAIESAREADGLRDIPVSDEPAELDGAPSALELRDPEREPALHRGLAEHHAAHQNASPLKVLTSGPERPIAEGRATFIGGRWRMVERDPWWERDRDPRDVVFGHYWRRRQGALKRNPAILGDLAQDAWLGAQGQAFCVDFSVGRRYEARHHGRDPHRDCALAALRWPEGLLYFDDETSPRPTGRR